MWFGNIELNRERWPNFVYFKNRFSGFESVITKWLTNNMQNHCLSIGQWTLNSSLNHSKKGFTGTLDVQWKLIQTDENFHNLIQWTAIMNKLKKWNERRVEKMFRVHFLNNEKYYLDENGFYGNISQWNGWSPFTVWVAIVWNHHHHHHHRRLHFPKNLI